MSVRISHCSTSIENFNLCLKEKVAGFINNSPKAGDIIYLVVKVSQKSFCGARFTLDTPTDFKPWSDSENYVNSHSIKDIEFCEPFDISFLSEIGGKYWSMKYLQGAKSINDDLAVKLLKEEFEKNRTEKLFEFSEDSEELKIDKMTFIEAATEILKQNGNQPMSAREIWDRISERNLVKTNGKTPWLSLNTILIHHSREQYKKNIYFNVASEKPLKFILADLNTIHLGIEKEEETSTEEEIYIKEPLYSVTSKELGWKKLSVLNNNENIEYEISDCEEYTYVMEDKAHATIKIGKTKNDPEIRFNQLKTANPSIKLLHVFPSCQWSESELHKKFNDFQKDLEWFFFAKGLKNFISEEMTKHERVISSFEKKKELEISEKNMLDII